ncbi:MAG: adenylyltransferase/cytidyltransferase family protein [bacterium]
MSILAITSMYANPLHPGHIECLELSKTETGADELWVIVNNDHQAELKRGEKSFQNEQFRMNVVAALKTVDRVFLSIDEDKSVCKSLDMVIREARAGGQFEKIIFTK